MARFALAAVVIFALVSFAGAAGARTAPDATVTAARNQAQADGHIRVAVRVQASERLRVQAGGAIALGRSSIDLNPAHEHVDPGRTVLRLRPAADDATVITRALTHGEKAKA